MVHVDDDAQLWRYMGFDKFEMLLLSRGLYCGLAKDFEDPWEGRLPRAEADAYFEEMYQQLIEFGAAEVASPEAKEKLRQQYDSADLTFERNRYVSCWHMNDGESAAMWDLYTHRKAGIAIVTKGLTMKQLAFTNAPELMSIFAAVEYLDYERDQIRGADRDATFCKRKSFAHENEARFVCTLQMESAGVTGSVQIKKSILVPVDLATFIERVHIYPWAPTDFVEQVRALCARADLDVSVIKSDMYDPY